MDLVAFETELITKLEAELLPADSIEVKSYPNDFLDYIGQLSHIGGAILIAWQGSFADPPDPNSESVLTQIITHNWQFTILEENLSTTGNQNGIYDRIEEVRKILSGFTPPGFEDSTVLWPVDAGFLAREKGTYIYQLTMAHQIEESEE